MLSAMKMPTLLGEKTDSNEMDRIRYVNWAVRGRPGGYWNGHLGRSNGRHRPTLLGEIERTPTYQPFVRRHNHSCVYYGVRGNHRSQYMFDNSCTFDGALGMPETAIQTVAASLAQASLLPDMVRMMAILSSVPPEDRLTVGQAASALGGNAAQITSALSKVGATPVPGGSSPPSAGSNKLLIGLGVAALALGTAVVVVRRRRRSGRTYRR